MGMSLSQATAILPLMSRRMSDHNFAILSSQADMVNAVLGADAYLENYQEDDTGGPDPERYYEQLSTTGQAETLANRMRLFLQIAKTRFELDTLGRGSNLTSDEEDDVYGALVDQARNFPWTTYSASDLVTDIAAIDLYFNGYVEGKSGLSAAELHAYLDPSSQLEVGQYRQCLAWTVCEARIELGFP